MKPSSDLFELIKSLTKSEKRYFKRFCRLYSSGKENNYLKLFDVMDKQKVYDEKLIKVKFKNEKFIKQLNVTKNYLYSLVLKSLRNYNEKNSKAFLLKESASEIDILAKKRLFNQSYKHLQKAKKIATREENELAMLELFKLEKALLHSFPIAKSINKINTIGNLEKQLLYHIEIYNHNLSIESNLESIISKIGSTGNSINILFKNEIQKLVKDIKPPVERKFFNNFKQQFLYLRICYKYYDYIGNYNIANNYSKKLVILFQKNKYFSQSNIIHYCGVLHNYCFSLMTIGKYSEANKNLNKLSMLLNNKTIKMTRSYYVKLFISILGLKLLLNNILGNINEKNNLFVESQINNLKEVKDSGVLKTLYLHLSVNYLLNENFTKALDCINKERNDFSRDLSLNTEITARVVNFIIHYELKNDFFLKDILDMTKKFFVKIKHSNSLELLIIRTIYNISCCERENQKVDLYKLLRKEILDHHANDIYAGNMKEFDIISWIDSKIEKRSFKEIVREKANNLLE